MIYPPRPEDCIPPDMDMKWLRTWKCQLKHNDTRTIIHYDNDTIKLYNRHKEPLKKHVITDQLHQSLTSLRDRLQITSDTILDGGLIGNSLLILWDILRHNGKDLIGTTYQERHARLQGISSLENDPYLGHKIADAIHTPHNYDYEERARLWETVAKTNEKENRIVLEGIVYKDQTATLEPMYKQKNNMTWMVKSRITTGRHRF
jgi:ATP-dependent DNA ligase